VALIGRRVNLLYHEHDPARVEIMHDSKTYGFAVVLDVNVNCRIKRGKDTFELQGADTNRYGGGKLFGNGGRKETE
jgi:hypothetical protein